jgi:GT2 family glycosyltransferase
VRGVARHGQFRPAPGGARPRAAGKFLFVGDEKLYVRGVTYGTFRPGGPWSGFPEPAVVADDFAAMAAVGVNTVRVYTPPPRAVLDVAAEQGLWVMVGLPWEQHVTFLDERGRATAIAERVAAAVRETAGHPAILCYAVGNEIPASIVRWHGRSRVERFIERLYHGVKAEDADGLVTYVNYPSTEYLQLPFVDLVCFNVFLEDEESFGAYVARLQTIADERPLVLTELGLDSARNGLAAQADSLRWQIASAFAGGCAGAVVFSWTDEWHRGGYDVDDWSFGLVDRARRPKPALEAVGDAFAAVPFGPGVTWPRVSVVVCTHNGGATIGDCLAGACSLDYPDYEVIVVDDGSTDATAAIASDFDVTLLRTERQGLGAARNAGLDAATGEIVAYLDDDARPDPQWLRYLAASLAASSDAAVGGPNLAPPGGGAVADAVARAPGGPVHVLLADRDAEHIPGCNMAFRADRLREVGGFDPQFRAAGDDVDICWRFRERGWTIGFHPAAVVWHRRRSSVRAFFGQQVGYGRAEALLERKWPDKYNAGGHVTWAGRVYPGASAPPAARWRVYYGTWGTGLFQSIYERGATGIAALALMPEWYLVIALLAAVAGYELAHEPLLLSLPGGIPGGVVLLVAAVALLVVQAARLARGAADGAKLRVLTTFLTILQPLARLVGRLGAGLTPWRLRAGTRLALPWPRTHAVWDEHWRLPAERLERVEARLQPTGTPVLRGSEFDRWDVQVRAGILGSARVLLAVEEHERGRQLLRFRIWPQPSRAAVAAVAALVAVAALAAGRGAAATVVVAGAVAILLVVRLLRECASAVALCVRAVEGDATHEPTEDVRVALERRLAEVRLAEVEVRSLAPEETGNL